MRSSARRSDISIQFNFIPVPVKIVSAIYLYRLNYSLRCALTTGYTLKMYNYGLNYRYLGLRSREIIYYWHFLKKNSISNVNIPGKLCSALAT